MKGKMKKLVAFALATIMVLAMGMTAFAAGYSITLKDGKVVPEGHTYKVYQIFKGTLDSTGSVLSDVEYGDNYTGNSTFDSAYLEAKSITDANAFAESIELTGNPVAEIKAGESMATLPESGYYLVVDESTVQGSDQVSKFMVSVGGDIEITPKYSNVPDFEKTVGDDEDAAKATVDYAAGADIPFTLTATMKEDIVTYNTYKLVFNDELSDNLTFNADSLGVFYKNGERETAYADNDYTVNVEGKKITITMENILNDDIITGTQIIVKYTAKLAADVDSGEVANNKASLEYGNNGDNQGSGTTTTTEVKVYTFKLAINKVDEDKNPLTGAGFTLYDSNNQVVATIAAEDGRSEFEFKGLKAGTYRLEETTVPNGYNKMEDKTIIVGATVDDTTVTVTNDNGTEWILNGFIYGTDITNFAGVQLPSTGGIGTTIFYVVGGILVVGAGILLITKKRMSKSN